jgi:hypothetical protein
MIIVLFLIAYSFVVSTYRRKYFIFIYIYLRINLNFRAIFNA